MAKTNHPSKNKELKKEPRKENENRGEQGKPERISLAPLLFPLDLQPKKKEFNEEIMKVLNQVNINIPLLDSIKKNPFYAKFFKNLYTIKKWMNV